MRFQHSARLHPPPRAAAASSASSVEIASAKGALSASIAAASDSRDGGPCLQRSFTSAAASSLYYFAKALWPLVRLCCVRAHSSIADAPMSSVKVKSSSVVH